MVKRALLAATALVSTPAFAQTFPVPADIAALGYWGSDGWNDTNPAYATGATLNVLGDGSTSVGGTPPLVANGWAMADIPTSSLSLTTPQLNSLKVTATPQYCAFSATGPWNGTTACDSAKFRTTFNDCFVSNDDPVRNAGQPGQSHLHYFFGNCKVSAHSTYASLRAAGVKYARTAGQAHNASAYWMPAMIKDNAFGGNAYVVRTDYQTIYYNGNPGKTIPLPVGIRYVGLFNMDTGTDFVDSLIATANAVTPGRYSKDAGGGTNRVRHVYTCGGVSSQNLKTAAGADPFGGLCTSGSEIVLDMIGPACWDGVNLWSPGGYKHVISEVWDTVASAWVCPNGWYRIPAVSYQIPFKHQGPSDYMTWRLSSDGITGSNNTGTVAGITTTRGSTIHVDYMYGWDKTTADEWAINCAGAGVGQVGHECGASGISASQVLLTGGPAPVTGRNPQIDTTAKYNTTSSSLMFKVPTQSNGPTTLHAH